MTDKAKPSAIFKMTNKAKKMIDVILSNEGGYVNDPLDVGGETNFGISKRSYPGLIISKLTKEDAAAIYFSDYYSPLKCEDLPLGIALHHLDMGVNAGLSVAKNILQETEMKMTGILNPNGYACLFYADRRKRYYRKISNGTKIKFLRGWLSRVDRVQDLIESGVLGE
jgi:lysozyme family protein